jgi:hypothetical protein
MRPLVLTLGRELFMGCTSSSRPMQDLEPDPVPPPEPVAPAAPHAPADSKEPTVSSAHFTFVRHQHDRRPPLSTLVFDVSLRNPGDRARWFLLPDSVAKGKGPIATGAFGVNVLSFPGTGNVVVANFEAVAGFYALQLPPGAEVELRGLQLRLAGAVPADPLLLEFITADGFTIGGQPPAAWTKVAATTEARADATQKDAKAIAAFTAPDLKTAPVELHGAERFTELVPIAN